MATLSSCLIWQIISFILLSNEYGCVYAWTMLGNGSAIDLQKMMILAKKNETHFDLGRYVNKQNCLIWGIESPQATLKSPHPKTSHCLLRILVQRPNWAILLWKWTRRGRYSQWRSLSGQVEGIFVHKNWRGGYWQHLVLTGRRNVRHSRRYTRCFAPCFWRSHYQPQSWCRLTTSELL